MLVKIALVQHRVGEPVGLDLRLHLFRKQPDFVCFPEYWGAAAPMRDQRTLAQAEGTARATMARLSLDLSGRPYLVMKGEFKNEVIGDLASQDVKTILEALTEEGRLTLNVKFEGENDHHKAESVFKALGLADVSLVSPFAALTPVLTLFTAWFILGERPNTQELAGILIVVVSLLGLTGAATSFRTHFGSHDSTIRGRVRLGLLFALLSAIPPAFKLAFQKKAILFISDLPFFWLYLCETFTIKKKIKNGINSKIVALAKALKPKIKPAIAHIHFWLSSNAFNKMIKNIRFKNVTSVAINIIPL